jgi:hypothetical protein
MIEPSGEIRKDAPWMDLVAKVRFRLDATYDDDVDLDMKWRFGQSMQIDKSVVAATLLRRLVISMYDEENHVALGPPETSQNDFLTLIHKGKTPFFLRGPPGSVFGQRHERDEYTVVGECFTEKLMDECAEAVVQGSQRHRFGRYRSFLFI